MQRVFLLSFLWIGSILLFSLSANIRFYSKRPQENIKVSLVYENSVNLYELEPYSTIDDLLSKSEIDYKFDESKINRNQILGHRDVINLPEIVQQKCISINTSTQDELETIKGIGSKAAQAIIDFRAEYGNFTFLEDIMKVKGIGKSKFEAMKDSICL